MDMATQKVFLIKDFQNEMTWHEVKLACHELENGWRIPTNNELNYLLKNSDAHIKKEIQFVGAFWSSNMFNINQSWKFTIRKWRECAPGYSTYTNLLRVVRAV